MNGLEISPFIQSLPKVELHIHIEGTLTPRLRWKLSKRNNIKLPYDTYEDLVASYAVTYNHRKEVNGDNGAPTFLEAFYAGCQVLQTEEDFYELAMEYFQKAAKMNVRYVEPMFSTQDHIQRGIPAQTVLDGYLRAQHDGPGRYGIHSNWIFCFLRDHPVLEAKDAYEEALPWGSVEGGKGLFHAVGLASNEFGRPPLIFEQHFRCPKSDGLHVTMHCDVDQKDAVAHVHETIFDILNGQGTERIDHGLNAVDDPRLIAGLRARNIPLTLCPHAYHRRQKTEVLFPKITKLWKEGVKICINSDDPTYMHNVWIDGNMQKVYTYCSFTKVDMINLVRNAVEASWAEQGIKEAILDELAAVDVTEDN
ncbi:hypothetical protein LTR84_005703 [Exophiala bonariae]|uniref:Adenosine deaminase domain-containing protein n=1 Tax=Exophiala bonariae TaxID=1690606 RepID=A0AAV9N6L4_9EURO|nr:hypothetical protein LTR84_005703 [Exophiala bonariae]